MTIRKCQLRFLVLMLHIKLSRFNATWMKGKQYQSNSKTITERKIRDDIMLRILEINFPLRLPESVGQFFKKSCTITIQLIQQDVLCC